MLGGADFWRSGFRAAPRQSPVWATPSTDFAPSKFAVIIGLNCMKLPIFWFGHKRQFPRPSLTRRDFTSVRVKVIAVPFSFVGGQDNFMPTAFENSMGE